MSELKKVVGIPSYYIIDMNESMDIHPIYISKLILLTGDENSLFEECLNIGYHFCTMPGLGFDVRNMDYNLTDSCYSTVESLIDGLDEAVDLSHSEVEWYNETCIQLSHAMATITKDLMIGMGPILGGIDNPDVYIGCEYDRSWVYDQFGEYGKVIYPEIAIYVYMETWR